MSRNNNSAEVNMYRKDDVLARVDEIIGDPLLIEGVKLPAVREVLEHVATAEKAGHAYTKHSAHTKTSTKGCVMGCIGG